MTLKQDIASRIMIQGNAVNVFYKNQPRSCFVCAGAWHEAKNCPWQAANKRAAPADPTNATASKAPRTFAAAAQPAAVIIPPADPVRDPPADEVPPPIPAATGDPPSDHPVDPLHGPQPTRVPPPA